MKLTLGLKSILALALIILMQACGQIPSQYQGDYLDRSSGAQLNLAGNKGTLVSDGRTLMADAKPTDVKKISTGEGGIYIRPNPTNKDLLDVYWLNPKMATRQEESGLIWFDTEVLYGRFDKRVKDKVSTLKMIHSDQGNVMIDVPTGQWQVGWPAGSETLSFQRQAK